MYVRHDNEMHNAAVYGTCVPYRVKTAPIIRVAFPRMVPRLSTNWYIQTGRSKLVIDIQSYNSYSDRNRSENVPPTLCRSYDCAQLSSKLYKYGDLDGSILCDADMHFLSQLVS